MSTRKSKRTPLISLPEDPLPEFIILDEVEDASRRVTAITRKLIVQGKKYKLMLAKPNTEKMMSVIFVDNKLYYNIKIDKYTNYPQSTYRDSWYDEQRINVRRSV